MDSLIAALITSFGKKVFKIDTINSGLVYLGLSSKATAATSENSWMIIRISQTGNYKDVQFASNDNSERFKWDDRYTLFNVLPFTNNYSLKLDGVNDYIDLGDVFNYEKTKDWTWSFWMKPTSMAANHTLYCRKTAGSVGISIQVLSNGRILIDLRNTNATNQLSVQGPTGNILNDTYYNIIVTYDGSSTPAGIKCYINGTSIVLSTVTNNLTGSIVSNGATATFGATVGSTFLAGYLDEVSHWNRVLTQSEVDSIYNSGAVSNLLSHSAASVLLGWWRMGDDLDTYPVIIDTKGGKNGSMTNMIPSAFSLVVP